MKQLLPLIVVFILLISCNRNETIVDAYGHFEADEIMISSEMSGKLLAFEIERGQQIDSGQFIARVDTQSLHLQQLSMNAHIAATNSKINSLIAQKRVAKTEIDGLKTEYNRIRKLVDSGAGKSQDLDQLTNKLNVARQGIKTFDVQIAGVNKETQYMLTQKALLDHQLRSTMIVSPLSGTVLETYIHTGELVSPNRPLAKIADLEKMDFRGYISETQLSTFAIGQEVIVRLDNQIEGMISYSGKIIWVADQAEFTPKIIQTKKERVNLVYAVLERVKNDGKIKIGMPGEMLLQ
ncbi:MAG: HlyD family efflux transporter periplasmic adaptor subunit [Bacteroidales bacterium]|nr:HlyD family efflux transporter periplasmic adaptor subunit [Bacteroidales bacterium]